MAYGALALVTEVVDWPYESAAFAFSEGARDQLVPLLLADSGRTPKLAACDDLRTRGVLANRLPETPLKPETLLLFTMIKLSEVKLYQIGRKTIFREDTVLREYGDGLLLLESSLGLFELAALEAVGGFSKSILNAQEVRPFDAVGPG